MSFLLENLATIIISLVIIALIALIIIKMIKDKRSGKSSCGCGCEHCNMACHSHEGHHHH